MVKNYAFKLSTLWSETTADSIPAWQALAGSACNILLVRFSDWSRERRSSVESSHSIRLRKTLASSDDAPDVQLASDVDLFLSALAASPLLANPLVLVLCPSSPESTTEGEDPSPGAVQAAVKKIRVMCDGLRGCVEVVDSVEEALGKAELWEEADWFDPVADRVAHVPFTEQAACVIATVAARRIRLVAASCAPYRTKAVATPSFRCVHRQNRF